MYITGYKSFYIGIYIHLVDGKMQNDSLNTEAEDTVRLSSKGTSVYYLGSAAFVVGIVLIILGTALIMFFQIQYRSEPLTILYVILSIAVGVILILVGINLMIKQTKRGYAIVAISIVFSGLASYLFYTNYLDNFYYPLVSYIFGLYILSFLTLLGNAFASVMVWIIRNQPVSQTIVKEKKHLYTDEEIQRDIEEATQKSLQTAVEQLQFELEELPKEIIVGKTVPKSPGTIIRIRDDIDEVVSLSHALGPAATEKFGNLGIEKASMQLAETISKEKKSKSERRKMRAAEKKEAKLLEEAKKKEDREKKKQEKIEAERMKMEAIKKEKELKKRMIEEERIRKIESKKAQKEEKKAKKEASRLEKKEAKKLQKNNKK